MDVYGGSDLELTVTLTKPDGSVETRTIQHGAGIVSFTNLATGNYKVKVDYTTPVFNVQAYNASADVTAAGAPTPAPSQIEATASVSGQTLNVPITNAEDKEMVATIIDAAGKTQSGEGQWRSGGVYRAGGGQLYAGHRLYGVHSRRKQDDHRHYGGRQGFRAGDYRDSCCGRRARRCQRDCREPAQCSRDPASGRRHQGDPRDCGWRGQWRALPIWQQANTACPFIMRRARPESVRLSSTSCP